MTGTMGRKPKDATPPPPDEPRKKRNAIFLTLDGETERRLQLFLGQHRIQPDRAAVALTALKEFLDREGVG